MLQAGHDISHHLSEIFGTAGAIVFDQSTNKKLLLTAAHIILRGSNVTRGDLIVSPAACNEGKITTNLAGHLERWVLDVDGDAAVCSIVENLRTNRRIPTHRNAFSGASLPILGEVLRKHGCATGTTEGKVVNCGRVKLEYGLDDREVQGFRIEPISDSIICDGGDCGSVWYRPKTKEAIGIHIAGNTDLRTDSAHAFACYATKVCERLNIRFQSKK